MSDLPFGLETKNTFAALSPADLQSMGKQAAASYLCGGVSLNDAIVKLARQHPSISPHQVQRVVEFANQETFAKLFSNNEKYASDKNIEFDVADPGEVLLEVNNGARPQILTAPPNDYSSGPVKHAHAEAEADLHLARAFLGVDWATPGSEKIAATVLRRRPDGSTTIDRILPIEKSAAEVADRILKSGEGGSSLPKSEHSQERAETHEEEALKKAMAMGPPIDATAPPPPPMEPPPMEGGEGGEGGEGSTGEHHEKMLEVQREIELAKKRQELQKVQQQTLDGMNPQGAPGAAPAPGPPMQGEAPGGPPPPPAPPGGAPVEMAPPPPPPAAGGPMAAPPGAGMPKTSAADLTKQAMAYVKEARPYARLVLEDLKAATALDRIKMAAADQSSDYPMANPYGDLIRTKQKLAKLLEDVTYARDKNRFIQKEAEDRFTKAVTQYMWSGGNIGEVAHLMSSVSDDRGAIKVAFDLASAELMRSGLDTNQAQARAIEYEMTKGASVRAPNVNHPIAQTFLDMCKLAEGNQVLTTSHQRVKSNYDEVERVLQEVAQHVASA